MYMYVYTISYGWLFADGGVVTTEVIVLSAIYQDSQNSATVSKAGLFIDAARLFIGASPDGIVYCKCC